MVEAEGEGEHEKKNDMVVDLPTHECMELV